MITTSALLDIFKTPAYPNEDHIYDFTQASETQKYFTEFNDGFQSAGHDQILMAKKTGESNAARIMRGVVLMLKDLLPENAVVVEIGGGSASQTRTGQGYKEFKHYYPLDISYSHIKRYTNTYNREGIVCNAERLPFKDNSVDCIYSNAFLEHPINPDKVVSEIARVIKPGGIVVHNDAWFCRWWQRYGIRGVKKWEKMTDREKLIAVAAAITETPVIRIPPIILRRIYRHLFVKESTLSFKKLKPNYTLYLGCDEDAASRIDPVDAIRFYESQGFELLQRLSIKQRLFYPNKYIALRKKI